MLWRIQAFIFILVTLSGCQRQTMVPSGSHPDYGAKVTYAQGHKLEYPNFSVEFVGEKPPRSYDKYPREEFRISGGGEVQEISWGRDQGDIGRVKFSVAGENYLMELVGSQQYGVLDQGVMVIWKNPTSP